MLSQIQRNLVVIALVSVVVTWASGVSSQQSPSPSQPSENSEQGGAADHKSSNNIGYPPQALSVIDFLSPDGLQKISAYCANKPDNEPDKWLHEKFICDVHFTDVIISIFTVLLVFVTGGLIWVGFRQIVTSRAQLRAYVFVHTAKVVILDDEVTVPTAVVVIKNSGQTPARRLINVSGFAVSQHPIKTMPNLLVSDREFASVWTKTDLGADNTTATTTPISYDPIYATRAAKAEFVKGLSEGKLIAFVYGEIRYRDVFKRRWWTKYRLMMGGPIGFAEGQLVGCNEGNEAT
jgi:hypothetical protein